MPPARSGENSQVFQTGRPVRMIVACRDYDDFIDGLRSRIEDLASSAGGQAAVDGESGAGDEAGVLGSQEEDGGRDLIG